MNPPNEKTRLKLTFTVEAEIFVPPTFHPEDIETLTQESKKFMTGLLKGFQGKRVMMVDGFEQLHAIPVLEVRTSTGEISLHRTGLHAQTDVFEEER